MLLLTYRGRAEPSRLPHPDGPWHRQLSLLAMESIDFMRAKGADVNPGDFARVRIA